MIKKLASIGVGAAMFLAAAVPAFAVSLDISNVGTYVTNNVSTSANTGYNKINDFWDGLHFNQISTGPASAQTIVDNKVNTTAVNSCNCSKDITVANWDTEVVNNVSTAANTGWNTINSGVDPRITDIDPVNVIGTGPASAQSVVGNVVNTNVVGF